MSAAHWRNPDFPARCCPQTAGLHRSARNAADAQGKRRRPHRAAGSAAGAGSTGAAGSDRWHGAHPERGDPAGRV